MYNKGLLYDTFNAKYLTYQEVAKTFIVNDEYFQLISNSHTLLMGPRGCGKTTLLKMLTPTALYCYEKSMGAMTELPFIGIYIPADVQWKSQLAYLEKHLHNKEITERITEFLITTNVQIHLCRTFNSIIRLNLTSPKVQLETEDNICRALVNTWDIDNVTMATFDDIELALLKRVEVLNQQLTRTLFFKKAPTENEFPDYIFTDFLFCVKSGCAVFEKQLNIPETQRWALCFDEMEITPKFFQLKIYTLLRSTTQKILFKVTTTPIVDIEEQDIDATQDNDFKAVRLWVYDDSGSAKWQNFCEKLILNKIQRRGWERIQKVSEILGDYDINTIIRDELKLKGSPIPGAFSGSYDNVLFKELARLDTSFSNFLKARKIDPANPIARSRIDNKSIFLKHRVKVLYRLIYKDRTRKAPIITYGIPYIYDISEGNPRSVIGLIDEMLATMGVNNYSLVPFAKQSEVISNVSKKYFNLIKNHPDSTLIVRNRPYNLANDIIKPIGNYIYNRLVKDEFDKTIPTTFTIDAEIDQKIVQLLEHALYLGAIIYLDPIESLAKNGIINKRFRLSYLLTPLFRIPNRVDGQINLTTILKEVNDNKIQQEIEFN